MKKSFMQYMIEGFADIEHCCTDWIAFVKCLTESDITINNLVHSRVAWDKTWLESFILKEVKDTFVNKLLEYLAYCAQKGDWTMLR